MFYEIWAIKCINISKRCCNSHLTLTMQKIKLLFTLTHFKIKVVEYIQTKFMRS